MNQTKIICTLGPACYDRNILKKLIQSGLNGARFNFSHANYEQSKLLLQEIKLLNEELQTHVATILDTKGPEIRTHEMDGAVKIIKDSEVKIHVKEILGNANAFSVTYEGLYQELNIGDIINVDDGYLSLEVIDKDEINQVLITKAHNTHIIKSRRGINVPNVNLQMDFISKKDRQDIIFAAKENYDYIAASFVRKASDIQEIKSILKEQNNNDIKIISKIENQEGMDNLEEIIDVSDGIMVARGDLGIEVPGEIVPIYQNKMIMQCLNKGKMVIVATQMLESMQRNPRPTKAEISDVFNAVSEGATVTMLSGESASGDYPVESVNYMYKINAQSETVLDYETFSQLYQPQTKQEQLLLSSVEMALRYDIKAIVVDNFNDAISIAKFHPSVCVFALVTNNKEANMLALHFGINAVLNSKELNTKISALNNESSDVIYVHKQKIEIKSL